MTALPTLRTERALLRSGAASVACVDEAGRGALSGPVSLALVVITARTMPAPCGVRDSKLLSPEARQALSSKIREWTTHAVGMATSVEVDRWGIVAAMRLAGRRALSGIPFTPAVILLDGPHDYLSPPRQPSLLDVPSSLEDPAPLDDEVAGSAFPPVKTLVKADQRCAGVAAASILAKVARDERMLELHEEYPEYGWAANKGYGSPDHLEALVRWGPTPHHRVTWRLPGRDRITS